MFRAFFLVVLLGAVHSSCDHADSAGESDSDADSDTDSDGDTDGDTDSDMDSDADSDSETDDGCSPDIEYVFCDDFESYEDGDYIVETAGDPWETWSNPPFPGEDAQVSTEQALSGSKSLYMTNDNDVVAVLGLFGGKYELVFNVLVEEGKLAWISLQQIMTGGGSGIIIQFEPDGIAYFKIIHTFFDSFEIVEDFVFEFNYGEWIEIFLLIDLDEDIATVTIGSEFVYEWPWAQVTPPPGSIDVLFFYGEPDPPGSSFYLDDIMVTEL